MKNFYQKLFILILVVFTLPNLVKAQGPVQLSLIPSIQIVSENQSVTVFRLAIYGKNTSTQYFDWGIVTQNTSGHSQGIQWSFVGIQNDFTGWQSAFVNYSHGNVTGLMTGGLNYSSYFTGLQFGIVNYTKSANGIQLGLLNFINEGGMLPIFPIFNFSLK